MLSKRSTVLLLLLLVSAAFAFSYAYSARMMFDKTDTYEQLWKKAEEFEKKGLTESALEVVNEIYQRAKTDNNAQQLVKAVLYKLKMASYKEEFSQEKNIASLQAEVESSHFPAKPVLQSLLAEAYWQYYQANRWKFYNRSETTNFIKEDVSTYDLKALVNATVFNYRASLQDTAKLKQTKVNVMDEVIQKGTAATRAWRPTLYDFLAHRALEFFKSSEADVTKAANQFDVNDAAYLKPYTDFLNLHIAKPQDSLDLKYYAVQLFRDLLQFHLQNKNDEALLDIEIERLEFANMHSKNELKDSLYIESLDWLAKRFEKSPRVAEVKHIKAVWLQSQATLYEPLQGEQYKWNNKKALDICNDILKNYPKSRGAQMAENSVNSILQPSMLITSEAVNDVQQPNRVLFEYNNVRKVYFKLVKTDYFSYQKLVNGNYDERTPKMLALPLVQSFEQELPDDGDHNKHKVEVKVPAVDAGFYILLASTSPQFNAKESNLSYQAYEVSNLAYLDKRKADGGYDFYVLERQSGQPLANVSATVWQQKYNYKNSSYEYIKGQVYTSNTNGFFSIESNTTSSQNFFLEFSNGHDKLFTDANFYNYKNYERNVKETHSFIFTDRAIYRPGQTVYFKSIVLNGSKNKHSVVTGQPLNVTFYDANGQKISNQQLVTNDYGTVSGSFTAPQGGLTGQMRINDGYGNVYVSVEEYKRPKFEVLFDTLRGSYKLNDTITVKGMAKAYAGNAIDGAQVSYRVVRRVNYPVWFYWYKPFYRPAAEVEIVNGTMTSNENGEYSIHFKALPDVSTSKKDDPTYTYEIHVDVTDINGETHSAQTYYSVGYKALELSFLCPDILNVKDLAKVTVEAHNLNGIEENATGSLTVYELQQPAKVFRRRLWDQPDRHVYSKEEYYKLFPNDLYEDENNQYKWARSKKAFTRNFDTRVDKNVVMNEFKNLSPGVYLVEGVCKDKYGEEVKSLNYVTVYDPASAELPVRSAQWTYDLKTSAEPGETASFIITSSYKDVSCIYDLSSAQSSSIKIIQPALKPVEIAVTENDRGGMSASTAFIKFGRVYQSSHYVSVPFTNKQLDIEYASFRNKLLPGQQEEWKLVVKNKKGEKAAAEMVATLYDASLDAFAANSWNFNIYNTFYPSYQWTHALENSNESYELRRYYKPYVEVEPLIYDQLNYGYGYGYGSGVGGGRAMRKAKARSVNNYAFAGEKDEEAMAYSPTPAAAAMADSDAKKEVSTIARSELKNEPAEKTAAQDLSQIAARKNFNETAFFFPELQTNENGEIIIKFTIPESLTKWRFMGLAHTKDLSYGQTQNEVVTQKDVMIVPNAPRFFREGDKMTFASKISNLSQNDLTANAEIHFFDAFTDKEISSTLLENKDAARSVAVKKGQSALVEWNISIPEGWQAIKYRVVAKAGNYSDGEEMAVPVLTNRMLVTESFPLPIRGEQTKTFEFEKFINQNNHSTTLRNQAYTLEFTANPAWYALQSLPYLMEYPYECAEQTFSRYYANALATHVVNSKPKIKQVFDAWKSSSPESFLSNLETNQELKALLLEETPWVMNAKNETENKKRIALFFDLNKMSNELNAAITKLQKMQTSNGAWPWFAGCPEDRYITQHIVAGLGHLQKLGVITPANDARIYSMAKAALPFCDAQLQEEYERAKHNNKNYDKENHLSYLAIHYLYMRSYFVNEPVATRSKAAFEYFKKQAQTYWLNNSRYMQGMLALALNRFGDKKTATDILKSLKENALTSEEMGMYWKDNYSGYYWHQAPVEMQALMIETFDEVLNDTRSVDDLKTWLIKSKQTQHWGTTKATTEAVYALLLKGTDWLDTEPNVEIQLGSVKLDPKNDPTLKAEAGTGYFKKTFMGSDIKPDMGKIKVSKKDAGVSWGAVYWQYFEQLDKITPHETPMKLNRKLFVEAATASGPVITPVTEGSHLKPGDKIKVRIELKVDRDMEYVHLKDMRAAGFEPVNVMSTYKYQDGLSYYESTRDAATNFFITYLPKGSYVFEYPLVVSHYGDFSNGVSSIQCMYAPEFTSHSEGIRVKVDGKK